MGSTLHHGGLLRVWKNLSDYEIPLFPLDTVLFPGGELPLQIFEQRYLDMVRECTRTESSFGVCLILKSEDEDVTRHALVGTTARICDWYTQDNGLLGIACQGTRRFKVSATHRRKNDLLIGRVEALSPETPVELPLEYSVLSAIVARYMEQAHDQFPDFIPAQLEDAVFVGYRLAELLPISATEKQSLLEMNDVLDRLEMLQRVLPRFQK